jgi:hypothetical protein
MVFINKKELKNKMIKVEVQPVVCDYGVFENGELKLILDSRSNAELIKNILEADNQNKVVNMVFKEGEE